MITSHLLARLRRRSQAQNIGETTIPLIGDAAQRLLDDPILKLAFQIFDDDLIEKWKGTKLGDRDGREELYRLHCALVEVDARLRALIGDGKRIEAERQRVEEEPDRWVA